MQTILPASLLHVVVPYFNPLLWASRLTLYKQFRDHMVASGVLMTVVECAYGERPYQLAGDDKVQHVPVRARSLVWTKENLINLGIARLPADARYIAWIDADIVFRRPDWAAATVELLQHFPVVMPWGDCYDLGPNGEHVDHHVSFAKLWHEGKPILQGPQCGGVTGYRFGHPGFCWAATRQALEWVGGLIETAALGAADHHMAMAMINRVNDSIHGGMSVGYRRPLLAWQERAQHHMPGGLSYVPGTIEHLWHGPKSARKYVDRWGILVEHWFDPDTDLKRNTTGVLELAGNKPALGRDIYRYMAGRDEDSNSNS